MKKEVMNFKEQEGVHSSLKGEKGRGNVIILYYKMYTVFFF